MSPREGMYYAGLMGGIIAGVMISRAMGWPQIAGLIVGLIVGVGIGHMVERAYSNMVSPPRNHDVTMTNDWIECPNKDCQWTGDPRSNRYCPRCGQDLPPH